MKAFVTGARGFVGRWLVEHLSDCGDEVDVAAGLDVTDEESVAAALEAAKPDVVYHLAGVTRVSESFANPTRTIEVNAIGTLCVLLGTRGCDPVPRVVLVSSSEVYGDIAPGEPSLAEDRVFAPATPYAASKAAAEVIAMQAAHTWGVQVVRARPFNHVGPGQSADFVVAAIAKRVAEAELAGTRTVSVGNTDAARDFTDVRDVVRAYRLLVEHGTPGKAYNVCSGTSVTIGEIASKLIGLSKADLSLVTDPALVRAVDSSSPPGDSSRLRGATGWKPGIPLDSTLADVLSEWRERAGALKSPGAE